ncbi:hypothetical protein FA95DRAFT_463288 [Auriscalpium vulgare]|uniref:Uncharacterized protein n=1 Tax=Auriscalpium vulgare TaxID=40419 RepID=A0ACB8SAW2_9AGAM|nr:hypothetical protein FA95DRAFT_463288 [Auriscalpium vulgare]
MWSYGVIIAELCLDGRLMPNLSYTTSMDEYGECLVKWSFESSNIKGTVPDDLHDLLSKLLKVNPRERLKLEDAKDHPFFAEIDWYKIEQRQWEPPRAIRLPRERGTVNLKQLFSASMPKRVAKPPTPAPSRYTSELASTAPESVGTAPGASNLYDWSRFEWSILDDPDYYLVKGPAARRG